MSDRLKAFLATPDPFAAWLLSKSEEWYDDGNCGDGLGRIDEDEAAWLAGKIRELFRTETAVQGMGMRT